MGADHTAGYSVTENILKVGGFRDPLKKEGQVELSRNLQVATATIDSTGLCLFVSFAVLDYEEVFLAMIDMINAQYGVNWTPADFVKYGQDVLTMEVKFNRDAGLTKNDDRLPEFVREELPPHNTVWDITDEELDKIFVFN
jgi:aldehyde:ferredoxin oxidoreductase